MKVANHQGWATARIVSAATTEVTWNVSFEPAGDRTYTYPTQAPSGLSVERVGLDGATLRWGAQYYLNAGYQVYLDGALLGYSGHTEFPLRGLDPVRSYTAEVKAVWDDASIGLWRRFGRGFGGQYFQLSNLDFAIDFGRGLFYPIDG